MQKGGLLGLPFSFDSKAMRGLVEQALTLLINHLLGLRGRGIYGLVPIIEGVRADHAVFFDSTIHVHFDPGAKAMNAAFLDRFGEDAHAFIGLADGGFVGF